GNLGVGGAMLLTPAEPGLSLISLRMNRRGADQMPVLGSNLVDNDGVALINNWINSLTVCP
ncbi:MAG: hypothetical protein OEY52_05790, partial [Gammaproteobacteria bacterium]|nr:hypothetical protein [Gammaproteobacteria bacterium]